MTTGQPDPAGRPEGAPADPGPGAPSGGGAPDSTGYLHHAAPAPQGQLDKVHARVGEHGFVRPRHGRLVAGVLAGLGRRFGISPWVARVVFLLTLLLPGPQILGYLALWVIMPSER